MVICNVFKSLLVVCLVGPVFGTAFVVQALRCPAQDSLITRVLDNEKSRQGGHDPNCNPRSVLNQPI